MKKHAKLYLFAALASSMLWAETARAEVAQRPLSGTLAVAVAPQDAESEKSAFLVLLNQYRSQHGLPPLALNTRLQTAAQWMSADMAANNYLSHTDSLGRSSLERVRAFGYTANTYTGENVAAGYATASAVLTAWQQSSGHNANMLSSRYQVIGIGLAFASGTTYGWYWTTDFGGLQTDPAPGPTATPTSSPAAGVTRAVRVGPNPASEVVYVTWQNLSPGRVAIALYNSRAEVVLALSADQPASNRLMLTTHDLAPGVYYYRFQATGDPAGPFEASGKLARE